MRNRIVREVLPVVAALLLAQPAVARQQDHAGHRQEAPAARPAEGQQDHTEHQQPVQPRQQDDPAQGHEAHGQKTPEPAQGQPAEEHEGHQMPSEGQPAEGGHQHGATPGPGQAGHSGQGHTMAVRVDVPELAILPGADPTVDPVPPGPVMRLEDFEQRATGASPALASAQAAVDAARGRARQAGLYPNPIVGYSADEVRGGEPTHGGQHGIFVDQRIVLGGKLGKRRDVLLGTVREAEAALEVTRFRVTNSVRLAYFDTLAAQQRIDLERRMVHLLQEAVRTSYGLFNVGAADSPDVLEIEIEARQSQVRLIQARSELDRARQQLAVTAGDAEMQFGRLEGSLVDALPAIEAGALEQILAKSPEVAVARAGIERARLQIRAARAERVPDLFVTGGARYNREHREVDNQHFEHLGWEGFLEAGVSIPVFNRNQGGISAAEAELRAAEAELRRLELGVRSRFVTVFTRYRDAARVSEIYRTEIIPRAERAYQLYADKYQEMAAAYPQVLIARRTWLQTNLDSIAALESLYRAALPLRGFLIGEATEGPSGVASPLLVSSPARGGAGEPE
jgi:cobalt-zinc-cadmium efflux system outer membrane protein